MRLLLINPWHGDVFPTPAIGYLQAAIKEARPEVDVTAADMKVALGLLEHNTYDIVGVTYHSFSVKYAQQIRRQVKGRLICGGHHPSALPQQMLDIGYDQVVVGEGENAIIGIIDGDTRPILRDYVNPFDTIDSIPFPDYSGLSWSGAMGMPIISSRGCPFSCSFCASSSFWGSRWKMRSAENVLAEIRNMGMDTFMFEDDFFTAHRKRAFDICDGLVGQGYSWQCNSRAETLMDEELCRALKDAGCETVWCGIESLSQKSLDRCGKHTTVEKMLAGIEMADKVGLNVMAQFIVGLPDDTEDDIRLTVENIKKSKIKRKGVQKIWIVPNTLAYDRAKARGFNDDVFLKTGSPYYTYEQDMAILDRWYKMISKA
jgi:anaerobic magnesium-protoporphyrin IX monomethyl ester cyclase